MARIIGLGVAAVVVLLLLWMLVWGFLHTLLIGFWFLLAIAVGFGVYRLGRWTGRGSRQS